MSSAGTVRSLRRDEEKAAASVLAAAFVDEPGFVYALPKASRRADLQWLFQRVIRAVWLQKGSIDCVGEEPNAVALWLEVKGQYREPLAELIRSGLVWTPVALGMGASMRLSKYSNAMLKLHRRHASGPHWYLQMVGVEPSKQGRGLGSRLLAHGLARASKLPVYLETDVERNVGLYRRHGFEVMEHASTAEPVPLWSMLRPPTPKTW